MMADRTPMSSKSSTSRRTHNRQKIFTVDPNGIGPWCIGTNINERFATAIIHHQCRNGQTTRITATANVRKIMNWRPLGGVTPNVDMSGDRKAATLAGRRQLDAGVRRHLFASVRRSEGRGIARDHYLPRKALWTSYVL